MVALTDVQIRELNGDDATEKSAIVTLVNRCYRGGGNWTTEKGIVGGPRITPQRLDECLCEPEMTVLVALLDGRIIGCIKTGVTDATVVGALDEPAGYFGMFAVHPDCSGRGIGNMLLSAAESHCKNSGMSVMMADVLHVRKDIIAYYNRKGYELVPNMSRPAQQVLKGAGEEILLDMEVNFLILRKPLV